MPIAHFVRRFVPATPLPQQGPPQCENAFPKRLFAGKGLLVQHSKTISPDVDEFFRPKTGLVTRETQKVGQVVQKGPFRGRKRKKGLACLSLCVLCLGGGESSLERGRRGRKEGGLMSPPLRLGLGLALEGGGGGGRGGGVFFSLTFLTIRNHTRGVSLPSSSSFCFFEEETPVYVRRREGERNSQRRTSSNGEL